MVVPWASYMGIGYRCSNIASSNLYTFMPWRGGRGGGGFICISCMHVFISTHAADGYERALTRSATLDCSDNRVATHTARRRARLKQCLLMMIYKPRHVGLWDLP